MNVQGRDLLQLETTIRTPENLELTYALAGAGSRSAAFLIDWFVLMVAAQFASNAIAGLAAVTVGNAWAVAVSGLLVFAVINGYFILFEWLMNGQTPGKRLIGIRTIKQGGYALRFFDVLLRNLMRVVDFLPAFYGVGLASLLLTPRCQRLGDLAAGTLVVQQDPLQTDAFVPQIPEVKNQALLTPEQLSAVPSRLVDLAVEFFGQRDQLSARFRQQIAVELSSLVRRVSGVAIQPGQSAESLLAAIILQSGRIPTSVSESGSPATLPS